MIPTLPKCSKSVRLFCWLVYYNCSAHMQRDLLWMWSHSQCLSKHLTVQVYCIRFADKLGDQSTHMIMAQLPFRGSQKGWGASWQELNRTTVFCTGRKSPWCCSSALLSQGVTLLKKNPKGLGRQKPNRSQKHDLETRGAKSILSCITMNRGQQTAQLLSLPFQLLLEYCLLVTLQLPPCSIRKAQIKLFLWRDTKVVRGCEKRPGEQSLSSLKQKWFWRTVTAAILYLPDSFPTGVKMTEPGSSVTYNRRTKGNSQRRNKRASE